MSTATACECTCAETLEIQFLGVEMGSTNETNGCSSCDTARSRLDAAIEAVRPALEAAGVCVAVSEQFVQTEREVRALRLAGSPTNRVGGVELRPEHRGTGEDGRVWSWNGEEHALPPQGMLIDAILRGYAMTRASGSIGAFEVSPYLQQFLKNEGAEQIPVAECGCRIPA